MKLPMPKQDAPVNRHTGGLEKYPPHGRVNVQVNRHTGGLENIT